jgi:hypothetical protein
MGKACAPVLILLVPVDAWLRCRDVSPAWRVFSGLCKRSSLLLLGCICCSATQVLRAYAAPADEQRFAPVLLQAVYLKRPLDVPAAAASLARTPHLHPCVFGTWRWIASLRWTLYVVNSAIAWLQHLRMAKSDSRQPRCLL